MASSRPAKRELTYILYVLTYSISLFTVFGISKIVGSDIPVPVPKPVPAIQVSKTGIRPVPEVTALSRALLYLIFIY